MKRARFTPTLLERPVQRAAIDLLARVGVRAVHVPNGAHLSGDRLARIKQMAALKRDGLAVGFPDLIVFGRLPLQVGFMECKREEGGVLSVDQRGWRDDLQALGFPWHLVCAPEDAVAGLRAWGWRC